MTFLAPAVLAVPAAAASPHTPGTVPGAWIVTLDAGESPYRVSADHAREHGAQVDHVYRHTLRGYAARMSDGAVDRIARDPRVASVQRDRVVTASAQTVPTGIYRIDADTSSTSAGSGNGSVDVDVAVIDTGIDTTHPDLNLAGGKNCVKGGKNTYDDGNGHGSHVAGTIGAKDDGIGVVGVAPGARLWAVRVLDNRGSGSWSSIICGVDWVTGREDIEVANMSLGGDGSEPVDGVSGDCSTGDALHDAICTSVTGPAGIRYAVAAGNSSEDAAGFVPAAYDEVITVSALADADGESSGTGGSPKCRADEDDTFANFSNHGADVDLIAPGVCILSTWKDGGYHTISGTSMASPHVAGALYKAANPLATPLEVQSALVTGGNLDWSNADDRDATKETLLNVAGF
ncbi:MAG: S8 family serine peptidase [Actinomycetota bacterium]|nr:S8 family serine peptidase [Actinomycetota bacterium]